MRVYSLSKKTILKMRSLFLFLLSLFFFFSLNFSLLAQDEVGIQHYEKYLQSLISDRAQSLGLLSQAMNQDHIGIEIFLAEARFDHVHEFFGEVFLRLIDDDQNDLNDLVIHFEMQNIYGDQDHGQRLLESVSFGSNLIPVVTTLNDFILHHIKMEKKQFLRMIIPCQLDNLKKLKESLYQLHQIPDLNDDYHVILNNSLGGLLTLFHQADLPIENKGLNSVPMYLNIYLSHKGLLLYPTLKVAQIGGLLQKIKRSYRLYYNRKSENGYNLDDPNFFKVIKNLSSAEIYLLYNLLPVDWNKIKIKIALEIHLRKKKGDHFSSLVENLNLEKLSHSLYLICKTGDDSCRKNRFKDVMKVWPYQALIVHKRKLEVSSWVEKMEVKGLRFDFWNAFIDSWNKWDDVTIHEQNLKDFQWDLLNFDDSKLRDRP